MLDIDLYTAIAVFIVGSINLLKCSKHEITLNRWLSPFSVGWILSGLTMFLPMVQKGAIAPMAAVYFLIGVLIANTLVLSFCSRLPNRMVDLKSPTVEMMGGVIVKLIGAGLYVMLKDMAIALFQWIDGIMQSRRQAVQLDAA
jgi:O-antigen/teichoic acid export membrane protein